jgi:hypothetical protein
MPSVLTEQNHTRETIRETRAASVSIPTLYRIVYGFYYRPTGVDLERLSHRRYPGYRGPFFEMVPLHPSFNHDRYI